MNFGRNPLFAGTINELRRSLKQRRKDTEHSFRLARSSRNSLSKLLVVCGKVGEEHASLYKEKAKEIGADFVEETGRSWILAHQTIKENYEAGRHEGVLLIGTNKQLPATQISYGGSYGYTDWFVQDTDDDGVPDAPVGRVFGTPEAILYHMDPMIIDSNIAVIFDSQPGRSMRHVEALRRLGFQVEILSKFHMKEAKLLSVSEFILQFSDGVYDTRIHGTPERWRTQSSVILDYKDVNSFRFEGYPVVYSEACSTAQEGPLLRAFLNQGACYIGATIETLNNVQPFDNWRECAYADGWKFGFMDLLDSRPVIGEVKLGVDAAIYENLDPAIKNEIELIRSGESYEVKSDQALSAVEWILFGNPLRRTTVGPQADFSPGQLIVDT